MVGGHADFVAVFGAQGGFLEGEVDGGVADEGIEGAACGAEAVYELVDAFEGGEIQVKGGVGVLGDADFLGDFGGFFEVAAGHDDVPVTIGEGFGCIKPHPGGGSCDDDGGFLSLFHFLKIGGVL